MDDAVECLTGVHASLGQSVPEPAWPGKAPSRTGLPTLTLTGGTQQIDELLNALKQPRIQSCALAPQERQDVGFQDPGSDAGAEPCADVPEFEDITTEQFEAEAAEYKRILSTLPEDAVKPHPPLNPEQRSFARADLKAQQIIARGRSTNEEADITLARLAEAGLKQIALLQGAGGRGKSVLLLAQRRVLARQILGTIAITAWTGVAAAPFITPTHCSLLAIDFTKLNVNVDFPEKKLLALRADFALFFGDPQHLLEFVVGEVSFLDPAALHHIDIQLQRLLNRPGVPFGGVLLRLYGDFWQKAPPWGHPSCGDVGLLRRPCKWQVRGSGAD